MAFGVTLLAGYSGQSRAGKIAPSCPLGWPITAGNLGHLARSRSYPYNKYGLLTKCEVKTAGYWPSSFFACLWTETKSRSMNLQKKERGQYPAILTEQTWSIKDLLYGFWGSFACGIQRAVQSGQDRSILSALVANHSARFRSSCPLAELAI